MAYGIGIKKIFAFSDFWSVGSWELEYEEFPQTFQGPISPIKLWLVQLFN